MSPNQHGRPESNRICNIIPSRDTHRDWRVEHALETRAITEPPATLPPSVDLRVPWWDIGNQKNTGSCVGWGSTDGVARYHFVKAGRIPKEAHLSIRLSWLGSKELDGDPKPNTFLESCGTSLKGALDILRKFGAVPDTVLPFEIPGEMYVGKEETFYALAARLRLASYFNLLKNLNDWKLWLVTHGPVLAALNVDATWDHAASAQGKLDVFQPNTVRGGHCVAIVGYTTDQRFIIRNSWGTTWGDQGFGYATEDYIKKAFFDESYGITV